MRYPRISIPVWHTLPLALLLLLVVACSRHEERLRQLEQLEARNSADSMMTDDALAETLASYFDDGGTPNERMRAHYILARTYADLGETPAALQAFLDAAEAADTTDADCDWAKLSRVYGQMSALLYNQNLMYDYIEACGHSIRYAWKAQDTAQALNESLLKLAGYDRLQQPDLVIKFFDSLYRQFGQSNESTFAACAIIPAKSLLKKDSLERAHQLLTLYETKSGFFDSVLYIRKGKESYYYYKGEYCMHALQYDSAEYYFRRILNEGHSVQLQNMASQGLATLYDKTGKADSAAKYALYSYAMNDSVYAQMATAEVENKLGMYNYTRHQKRASQEHQRAESERTKKLSFAMAFFVLLTLFLTFLAVWQKRKRKIAVKYQKYVSNLSLAKAELNNMKSLKNLYEKQIKEKLEIIDEYEADRKHLVEKNKRELSDLVAEKDTLADKISEYQNLIECLHEEVEKYRKKERLSSRNEENLLAESPVYQELVEKSGAAKKLSEKDWAALEQLIEEILPEFHNFLSARKRTFTDSEYKTCILLRLHIRLKQAAGLIGISKTHESTICTGIMDKVFGEEGSGKELKKRLESIF